MGGSNCIGGGSSIGGGSCIGGGSIKGGNISDGVQCSEVADRVEKVHGHHQVSTLEVVGSWMAVLLAALWQLGKLLAMHAGGAAAGAWRLLWRRRKVFWQGLGRNCASLSMADAIV